MSTLARLALLFALIAPPVAGFAKEQERPTEKFEQALGMESRFQRIFESSAPKTVLVETYNRQGYLVSSGSGAIVSTGGHVLTCQHVVAGGASLQVRLTDGRRYEAVPLSENEVNDYALLKIEAENLSRFEFGDSSRVKAGDWVIALGHPLRPNPDGRPAMSVGRVMDPNKGSIQGLSREYPYLIETDAPIFSGNSGGPLVNMRGELIGINAAIRTDRLESYSIHTNFIRGPGDENMVKMKRGLSVAPVEEGLLSKARRLLDRFLNRDALKDLERFFRGSPTEDDKRFNDELRKEDAPLEKRMDRLDEEDGAAVHKPYLGLMVRELTDEEKAVFSLSGGLYVERVVDGGPATRADIRAGDIITSLVPIKTSEEPRRVELRNLAAVRRYLDSAEPGESASVDIIRGSRKKEITLTLGSRTD